MRLRFAALALLTATFGTPQDAAYLNAAEHAPELELIKKDVYYLAGEECDGRGVGTDGNRKAGEYVATAFRKAGLTPGGVNGTYFQPFEIAGPTRLGTPNTFTLTDPRGKVLDVDYGTDFTPTAMSGSGKTQAGVVFVGYGITAEKPAFDEYAGVDVKGKFVVVLRKAPRYGTKDAPFATDSTHPSLVGKVENAVQHGAAGVLFVNDAAEKDDALMAFGYARGAVQDIPVLHIKRAVLAQMLGGAAALMATEIGISENLKPRSRVLKDWTAAAEVTVTKNVIPARNVVAVSEGSGPLADETVVVGAHYDHLGRGEFGSLGGPEGKGKVHYGADDNASGTAGLMELARRFGAMKNRSGRRVVFVAFSGEERGLFGSIHYCKQPSFPLEKTVFMLNMDMIGRVVSVDDDASLVRFGSIVGTAVAAQLPGAVVKRDRVVVYGTGTADGLNELVTVANRGPDFKVLRVPGGTGPSDHDSFYRKKVPVLFFFTGTHRDYHRPSDTADKINYAGLKKVADMAEFLLMHLAEVNTRPKYLVTTGGWADPTEDRPRSSSRTGMPKLGIMPGNYEATSGGVLVEGLSPGGAAEKGGVMPQDVVVEIAGRPVKEINSYMTAMAAQKAGQQIEVVVLRKDKRVTLKVVPLP